MANTADAIAGIAIVILLGALAGGLLVRLYGRLLPTPKRLTVGPFQHAVVLRDSAVVKVLPPGTHWIGPRQRFALCDIRPKPLQIKDQDVIAADNARLRLSLGGEFFVKDPASFITATSDSAGAFYLELRLALRIAAGELSNDALLAPASALTARIRDLTIPRAAQLGIELTRIDVWEVILIGWPAHH